MFKKGDKVIALKDIDSKITKGTEGIVYNSGTDPYVKWKSFSSGIGWGEDDMVWCVEGKNIELYKEQSTIKTLNKDTVKVGQKVRVIEDNAINLGFKYLSNNRESILKKGYIGIITEVEGGKTNASSDHTWVYIDKLGGIGTMLLELLEEPKSESLKATDLVEGEWYLVESLSSNSYLFKFKKIRGKDIVSTGFGWNYRFNEKFENSNGVTSVDNIKTLIKASQEEVLKYFPNEFKSKEFTIPYSELLLGQEYVADNGNIFKHDTGKQHFLGNKNGSNINRYVYEEGNWSKSGYYRVANKEEVEWLTACIMLGKYITKEEVAKSKESEVLVFGKFKIGSIVVSLCEASIYRTSIYRKEGDMFKILPHSTKECLYYRTETHNRRKDHWRQATDAEVKAFESGITNINDMKTEEEYSFYVKYESGFTEDIFNKFKDWALSKGKKWNTFYYGNLETFKLGGYLFYVKDRAGTSNHDWDAKKQLSLQELKDLIGYKEEQSINTYGLSVGDVLPKKVICAWAGEGNNRYQDSSKNYSEWLQLSGSFGSDRVIEGFKVFNGITGFLVSDTHKVYLKAEGFKEFMDNFDKTKVEDKFIVGAWYKLTDCKIAYRKCLEIPTKDYLTYVESIECGTYLNNSVSNCYGLNRLQKVDIAEIQQYLPEGHIDKINTNTMELTGDWCIKLTDEVTKVVKPWFINKDNTLSSNGFTRGYYYGLANGIYRGYADKSTYWSNAKELTLDEFKRLVLKEDTTEDPLITEAKRRYPIGTAFYPVHLSQKSEYCIVTNTNFKLSGTDVYALTDAEQIYDSLMEGKYGNTQYDRCVYTDGKWAEIITLGDSKNTNPEEFKVGDWCTVESISIDNLASKNYKLGETFKITGTQKSMYKEYGYLWLFKGKGMEISSTSVRKATPEEIAKAQGYKFKEITGDIEVPFTFTEPKKEKYKFSEVEYLAKPINQQLDLPIVKKYKKKSIINL